MPSFLTVLVSQLFRKVPRANFLKKTGVTYREISGPQSTCLQSTSYQQRLGKRLSVLPNVISRRRRNNLFPLHPLIKGPPMTVFFLSILMTMCNRYLFLSSCLLFQLLTIYSYSALPLSPNFLPKVTSPGALISNRILFIPDFLQSLCY